MTQRGVQGEQTAHRFIRRLRRSSGGNARRSGRRTAGSWAGGPRTQAPSGDSRAAAAGRVRNWESRRGAAPMAGAAGRAVRAAKVFRPDQFPGVRRGETSVGERDRSAPGEVAMPGGEHMAGHCGPHEVDHRAGAMLRVHAGPADLGERGPQWREREFAPRIEPGSGLRRQYPTGADHLTIREHREVITDIVEFVGVLGRAEFVREETFPQLDTGAHDFRSRGEKWRYSCFRYGLPSCVDRRAGIGAAPGIPAGSRDNSGYALSCRLHLFGGLALFTAARRCAKGRSAHRASSGADRRETASRAW